MSPIRKYRVNKLSKRSRIFTFKIEKKLKLKETCKIIQTGFFQTVKGNK